MANDELGPGANSGATGRVTCEFCKCSLAGDGAVLRRSERAKTLMDLEDTIDKLRRDLDDAKRAATDADVQLKAALKQLDARPAPAAAGLADDDW